MTSIAPHQQNFTNACQELLSIAEELVKDSSKIDDEETLMRSLDSLVTMKSSQRSACHNLAAKSEELERQKSQLEASKLIYHNLVYERDHLLREIEACKKFENVELEKLAKSEGYDIMSSYLSSCISTGKNVSEPMDQASHQAIMEKLTDEIYSRKNLQKELEDMEAECIRLKKVTEKNKRFLSSIPGHLTSIERATMPLQKHFDVNKMFTGSLRRERYERASKLEAPLYTLCCQLEAYADANSHVASVDVVDSKLSQGFGASSNNSFQRISNKKRMRLEPKSIGDQAVRLDLKLTCHDGEKASATLFFFFSLAHNVVSVECREDPLLLDNLFPGDNGESNPNMSNHYTNNIDPEDSTYIGKPYRWVQYISGQSFLYHRDTRDNKSEQIEGLIHVETSAIMKQLIRRITSRAILRKKILIPLSRSSHVNSIPVHDSMRNFFTNKLPLSEEVTISSWSECTEQRQEEASKTGLSTSSVFYKATIKHQSTYLNAFVEISPTYPVIAPKWKLESYSVGKTNASTSLDDDLHSIQTAINAEYLCLVQNENNDVQKVMDYILGHQFRFLVACFDELVRKISSSPALLPNNGSKPQWRNVLDSYQSR